MNRTWQSAIQVLLVASAGLLTLLWLADVRWAVFLGSSDEGADVGDFLWLVSGAVVGVLAGFATMGRMRHFAFAVAGIAAVTVVAFVLMPYDVEGEGGGALALWWALLAVTGLAVSTGLMFLARRLVGRRSARAARL